MEDAAMEDAAMEAMEPLLDKARVILSKSFPNGIDWYDVTRGTFKSFISNGYLGCAPAFPSHLDQMAEILGDGVFGIVSCEMSPKLKVLTIQGVFLSESVANISLYEIKIRALKIPKDSEELIKYAANGHEDLDDVM